MVFRKTNDHCIFLGKHITPILLYETNFTAAFPLFTCFYGGIFTGQREL